MRELLARAAQAGLSVHGSYLSGDRIGLYAPELKRIYFDLRSPQWERVSAIGHELGHHHYGHDCSTDANERQADAYAAALLVNPSWYAELETISIDAEWIAEEMGVAPWVILDYRRYCLQRIGNTTYVKARMGAGQWDHRAVGL